MSVQHPPQPADQVSDLDVSPAYGAGRVGTTHDAGDHRVQLGVLDLFVGSDLVLEETVH